MRNCHAWSVSGTPSGDEILPKAVVVDPATAENMVVATIWRIEGIVKEDFMASTESRSDGADRITESLQEGENSALEAVRKFLDTVNGVFPDVSAEGGPRQKIIDSAFKMTEQLVGTWNQLAQRIAKVSQDALAESEKDSGSSKV